MQSLRHSRTDGRTNGHKDPQRQLLRTLSGKLKVQNILDLKIIYVKQKFWSKMNFGQKIKKHINQAQSILNHP